MPNGFSKTYKTFHYHEEYRGMKLSVFSEGEGHKTGFQKEQKLFLSSTPLPCVGVDMSSHVHLVY